MKISDKAKGLILSSIEDYNTQNMIELLRCLIILEKNIERKNKYIEAMNKLINILIKQ